MQKKLPPPKKKTKTRKAVVIKPTVELLENIEVKITANGKETIN